MFSHMPIEKRLLGHEDWVECRHRCTDLVRFTFSSCSSQGQTRIITLINKLVSRFILKNPVLLVLLGTNKCIRPRPRVHSVALRKLEGHNKSGQVIKQF